MPEYSRRKTKVETAFKESVCLGEKLRAVRIARARDGEAFVSLAQNPTLRECGIFRPVPTRRAEP